MSAEAALASVTAAALEPRPGVDVGRPDDESNSANASVGSGTNERCRWSTEMHAGPSTSANSRSASSPPRPFGVTVRPAIAASSAGVRGPSSGGGSIRTRSTL